MNRLRKISTVLLLAIIILPLMGCADPAAAKKLADAGSKFGTSLKDYYSSLESDLVDIWEAEAFISSIRSKTGDDDLFLDASQQLMQSQIDAIEHRMQLAHQIESAYSAMQQLSSYDASAEIGDAAKKLSTEIKALPILPKSKIDPSDIFGSLAGELAAWKQSRDLKRGSELILKTLNATKLLFERETEAYKSIATERGQKMADIVETLITSKLVVSWAILNAAPKTLDLTWANPKKPIEDNRLQKAVIQLAKVRLKRLSMLSASAADDIDDALSKLIKSHNDFEKSNSLSITDALAAIQKVQSYVDQIAKLRAEIRDDKKKITADQGADEK